MFSCCCCCFFQTFSIWNDYTVTAHKRLIAVYVYTFNKCSHKHTHTHSRKYAHSVYSLPLFFCHVCFLFRYSDTLKLYNMLMKLVERIERWLCLGVHIVHLHTVLCICTRTLEFTQFMWFVYVVLVLWY